MGATTLDLEQLTDTAPLNLRQRLGFRTRSLSNLLRMGHCAPAVMKTILELCRSQARWPVMMAAGLPGGIGDTGFECGGITAPLIFLGLRHGLGEKRNGLPIIFHKGHDHFQRFVDRNHTPLCREIRGDNYRLRRCIRAVCCAPEIAASVSSKDSDSGLPAEKRDTYAFLYSRMEAGGFHCAHQVLQRLAAVVPLSRELLDATSGFLGGTLFKGLTCSAYAAGVMALGFGMGEFENSLPRVMRMIVLMKTGGTAFADGVNNFNRIMNRGKTLAGWFAEEFGDTRCRAITGCDFSSAADAERFVQSDAVAGCQAIAEKVASRVLSMAVN
jgi:C_GCAxxG_C_C family probable redox protein